MKKDNLGDLSGIETFERFRLSVKALARTEKAFFKQVVRSCPPENAVEYLSLLEAASACTIQVTLAIHMVSAQWEMMKALVLEPLDLDCRHVEFYYTTYRGYPELWEGTCRVVEEYYDLLAERCTGMKGVAGPGRSEIVANTFSPFLPHFYYVHHYGVEGIYSSEETDFETGLLDSALCMIACYHLDMARQVICDSLCVVWAAFSSFCRSVMDMEPDTLMKAYGTPAAVSLVDEFSYELEELDVESNVDQSWESKFRDIWQSCAT